MISLSTLFCGFAFLNGNRVMGDMRQSNKRHGNRVMEDMVQGNKRHGNRVIRDSFEIWRIN
mgnify:CR=1 FL=1